MKLSFMKMHANGDDFVIVDLRRETFPLSSEFIRLLGDRNRGIGFNQLAVISACSDATAKVVFWNADGTHLDTCGSATRGVSWKLMQETGTKQITLRTNRGLLTCIQETESMISVDMGEPVLDWKGIPVSHPVDTLALPLPGLPTACSMGNPHCTFFVDDLRLVDVEMRGREIETNPLFPQKTNVHFVQVLNSGYIRLRIWERGGGIPLGSGSCCCGAVVNGIRRGFLDNRVQVECDGGSVFVHWDDRKRVFLSGDVSPAYEGIWCGDAF